VFFNDPSSRISEWHSRHISDKLKRPKHSQTLVLHRCKERHRKLPTGRSDTGNLERSTHCSGTCTPSSKKDRDTAHRVYSKILHCNTTDRSSKTIDEIVRIIYAQAEMIMYRIESIYENKSNLLCRCSPDNLKSADRNNSCSQLRSTRWYCFHQQRRLRNTC
jgi:hypothetical protein